MYIFIINFLQLGAPTSNKFTIWIMFFCLPNYIELVDPATMDTCGPNPASPVVGHIIIYKCFFEILCSQAPVQSKVMCQVTGHNLSATVAHVPLCIHLPHECIDQWHPSRSFLPPSQLLFICIPIILSKFEYPMLEKASFLVLPVPKFIELSPMHLIDKFVNTFPFFIFLSNRWVLNSIVCFLYSLVDFSNRKGTVRNIRREFA